MSFVLDFKKMQIGDIVISSGTRFSAQLIKLGTWSKNTHVMIYVGNTMMHAVREGGVFSKNPQRELYKSDGHVKVFRLKNSVGQKTLKSICDYARGLTGSVYSLREAFLTKAFSEKTKTAKTKMQFCSRLVAQSYEFAGINLVENPSYCFPKDISESSLLREVSGIVREASQAEIEFSKTPDPTLENQKLTYDWLYKSKIIADKSGFEIQTITDVSRFIDEHPDQDSVISEFIKSSGYLEHYRCDCQISKYRYNSNLFIRQFYDLGINLEAAIENELDKEPSLIQHAADNYIAFKNRYEQKKQLFHKLHAELYLNILLLAKVRLVVMFDAMPTAENHALKAKLQNCIASIDRLYT